MHYKKGMAAGWAVLITAIIMLGIASGGYYYLSKKYTSDKNNLQNQINDLNKQISDLKKASSASSTASSSTGTNASSTAGLTYTDSDYHFTITLNSKWAGWKVKYANLTGSTATLYFEVPTSDSNWATAGDTHDAGYTSLFAVSVYTKEQWAVVEAEEMNPKQKLAENSNYVFAWSHSQAAPDDVIAKGIWDDIASVIATFKLT